MGRKWIMLGGMLLAVFSYRPIYKTMYTAGTLQQAKVLHTDTLYPGTQGSYSLSTRYDEGSTLLLDIKNKEITKKQLKPGTTLSWTLGQLIFLQVFLVTMVYGSIAAFLVEMFPVQVLYTSILLTYH